MGLLGTISTMAASPDFKNLVPSSSFFPGWWSIFYFSRANLQLIPHFTWGSGCGEIAHIQGRPWTSSFIKCSSLSRRWEALSFTVFLLFQPRAICLLMFFLLRVSTLLLPQSWLTSLQVTLLQEIPMSLPKPSDLFASSFFRCCSLLTLKATSPS